VASSEWDEEVRAVVALRPGADVSADELKTYLRQSLAGYKIPKLIKFIQPEQMPVNPSGKIVKSRLREVVHW
jgi:fatty-acyl-CoA synthase